MNDNNTAEAPQKEVPRFVGMDPARDSDETTFIKEGNVRNSKHVRVNLDEILQQMKTTVRDELMNSPAVAFEDKGEAIANHILSKV